MLRNSCPTSFPPSTSPFQPFTLLHSQHSCCMVQEEGRGPWTLRRSKTALPEFFSSFSHRRRPRPLKLKLNGFTSSLKSEDEGVCVLLCRLIWFSSFGCPQQASAPTQAGGADRQTAGAGSSSHCPVTRNSFCCCPESNSNKTTLEKPPCFCCSI